MKRIRLQAPYSPDMALSELSLTEGFVLTALRLWNHGAEESCGRWPRWREAFNYARIELVGALAFDRFCRMLALAATRACEIRAVNFPSFSPDEGLVLQVLAHVQHDHGAIAQRNLTVLVPPDATRILLNPAYAVTTALAVRELWLPERAAHACLPVPPLALRTASSLH
jgi:hypothetical protein